MSAGVVAASIIGLLGMVHLYWAAGGHRGLALAIPQRAGRAVFTPPRTATFVVAILLMVAALLIAGAVTGWGIPFPRRAYRWAATAIAVVFLLRALGDFRFVGLFKRVRGTPFARWDTALFSPLCALVGVLILIALRR